MKLKSAFLVLAFCFLFYSAANAQSYTVSGVVRVLSTSTGAAISGARIDIGNGSYVAKASANGTFSIPNVPSGTYTININEPGYFGFSQSFNVSGNTTINASLPDTTQHSPAGTQTLTLAQYTELNWSTAQYPNGDVWHNVTEGSLIPVYLANATSSDSASYYQAINTFQGNLGRTLYTLSNDSLIGTSASIKGVRINFNASTTNTNISYNPIPYIYSATVNLSGNNVPSIIKELFGRVEDRGDVGSRNSYMNGNPSMPTDLDYMLNMVFFNFWASIDRGEQSFGMFYMNNYVNPTIPGATTLSAPANNTTGLDSLVNFSWSAVSQTYAYELQIAKDSNFTNIVVDASLGRINASETLNSNTQYFWRVRSSNSAGTGPWSIVDNFTTKQNIPAPGIPVLVSPANNSVNQPLSLTLSYTPGSNASSSELAISSDSTFATVFKDTVLTGSSLSISGLSNAVKYFWHVRSSNTSGTSSWTGAWDFTTLPPIPATPSITSPANNSANEPVNPSITWNSVAYADKYDLQLSTDSTFTKTNLDTLLAATVFNLSNLSNSTKYFLRVNAQNTSGTSPWSSTSRFTTIVANPGVPVLVSPANGSTNQPVSLTLSFSPGANTSTTEIELSLDSTFAFIFKDDTVSGSTDNITGLTNSNKFYWRARSINAAGTSSWTSVWNFTTIKASVIAPSNLLASENGIAVTLNWNDNSNNELGFIIQRHLGDSATANPYQTIDTAAANATMFTDTNIVKGNTYTYHVYAFDADTVSDFSNQAEVTIPLPVEMTTFNAASSESSVNLTWSTATELNNKGFEIERKTTGNWESIGFIDGNGNSTKTIKYNFTDDLSKSNYSGKVEYRIKQIDYDGAYTYSKTIEITVDFTVKEFSLSQNYPNPFNPTTTINYTVPKTSFVTLRVYNILGKEVTTLVNENEQAGKYSVQFNTQQTTNNRQLSSGIYFYRMTAGDFVETKKLILLK